MNIQLLLAGAAFVAAFSFGAGWTVNGWRCDAAKTKSITAAVAVKEKAQTKVNKVAESFEVKNEQARVEYRTITKTVEKLVDRPVYRDAVCVDADGLRVLSDHIDRANAAR